MGNAFCKMILRTIQERGISQRDLCYGLCSASAFTRYLRGERRMDRLLMMALMQRLGESPDKFCPLLTEDEYSYFEWRHRVAAAHFHKDWGKLFILLQEPVARDISCNEVLQRQFYLLLTGIVQEKCFGNREESLRALVQAIALTVPDCRMNQREGIRLGVQEINALLLWQNLQPDLETSYRMLRGLVNYVDNCYIDLQEKCKLYPKVAAQYLPLLNRRKQYYECMTLAQKALRLIAVTGCAMGAEEILRAYAEAMSAVQVPGMGEVRTQLRTWQEIRRQCTGICEEAGDDGLDLLNMWQEAELLHEVIGRSRKERGYTQKKLCENICEPETFSRIESGRQAPHKKTYQMLAQRLLLPDEYYFSTIETDSFRTLELKWEFEMQAVEGQWQRAAVLTRQMEESLDMAVTCNRQYVEQARYLVEKGTGKIGTDDQFERVIQILRYSMEHVPQGEDIEGWPEEFWTHRFTERELSLLLLLADSLQEKKKYRQAAYLLERMLQYYQGSKVKAEFHFRMMLLIYGRLTVQYSRLELWDREQKYAELGIQMAMLCEDQKMLPLFLNSKADALEHSGEREAALKFYEFAGCSVKLLRKSTDQDDVCGN